MIPASSLVYIFVVLVFLQGAATAAVGVIIYAVFSRIPTGGWIKAGTSLVCAVTGSVIFAAMENAYGTGSPTFFAGIFLIISGPLIILTPIFILAEREEYAPYARYPSIIATLFCAAAIGGLIQVLNITAFLSAGASVFSPATMYLLSFAIMGGIQIILGAEFFMFAGAMQRRRAEMHEERTIE